MADLLDTLQSEIARKRKQVEDAAPHENKRKILSKTALASHSNHLVEPETVEQQEPIAEQEDVIAVQGPVDDKPAEENHMNEDFALIYPKEEETLDKDAKLKEIINVNATDFKLISGRFIQHKRDRCYTLIFLYLKSILFDWESNLSQDSVDAVQERKVYSMACDHLKPLLKLLKKKQLEPEVEIKLADICKFIYKKDYLNANDMYLRMSIGNAAWPIGVTQVGIHERNSRDKIMQSQVAHLLNDETHRKWMQSIKRLISYSEKRHAGTTSERGKS